MLPLLAGILGRLAAVSRQFHPTGRRPATLAPLRSRLIICSIAALGALLAAATTGGAATDLPDGARRRGAGGRARRGHHAGRILGLRLVRLPRSRRPSAATRCRRRATARTSTAISQLSGVSLLGGIVQISALSAAIRTTADGTSAPTGDFGGAVAAITVNGAAVGAGTGSRIDIPDLGYAIVDQRIVSSQPGADAYRGSEVALELHLDVGWHDMPAGTEVLVGYADAGISRVEAAPDRGGKAAPPTTTTTTTGTAGTGAGTVSLLPTAPLPTDIAGEPGIADGGPAGSDARAPGRLHARRADRSRAQGRAARPELPLPARRRREVPERLRRAARRYALQPGHRPVRARSAHRCSPPTTARSSMSAGATSADARSGCRTPRATSSTTGTCRPTRRWRRRGPRCTRATSSASSATRATPRAPPTTCTSRSTRRASGPSRRTPYVSAWLDNSAPLGGVTPAREHPVALVPLASFDISTASGLDAADRRRRGQRAVRPRRRYRCDRRRPARADGRTAARARSSRAIRSPVPEHRFSGRIEVRVGFPRGPERRSRASRRTR